MNEYRIILTLNLVYNLKDKKTVIYIGTVFAWLFQLNISPQTSKIIRI